MALSEMLSPACPIMVWYSANGIISAGDRLSVSMLEEVAQPKLKKTSYKCFMMSFLDSVVKSIVDGYSADHCPDFPPSLDSSLT